MNKMTSGKLGSNKNTSLKIFGASEMDKTPANCIPRICTLTISKMVLTKPINVDLSSVFLVVKMKNSRRTIRSSEININSASSPVANKDLMNDVLDNNTQNEENIEDVSNNPSTSKNKNSKKEDANLNECINKNQIGTNTTGNSSTNNTSSNQSPTTPPSQSSNNVLFALSPQQQLQQHLETLQLHTIELDTKIVFTFQYPHYLKKESNQLQIMIQRRKKYKNRAILGFKTLAIGYINLAEIFAFNNSSESSNKNEAIINQNSSVNTTQQVINSNNLINNTQNSLSSNISDLKVELRCNQTKPQQMHKSQLLMASILINSINLDPITQDLNSNSKRQKSLDKCVSDAVQESEDEEFFNWNEENSDTDVGETSNQAVTQVDSNNSTKQKLNKWRRQMNNRKARKLFTSLDKNEEQQRNLKQRLIALIRKFRMPDSANFESPEQYEAAIERELMVNVVDNVEDDQDFEELLAASVDLEGQGVDLDDLDDFSDYSVQEFDDCLSISSTPKPSLRPFFSTCTLPEADDEFKSYSKKQLQDEEEVEEEPTDENLQEETTDTTDNSRSRTKNRKWNEKKSKFITKTSNYIAMKDLKSLMAIQNLLAKHKSRKFLPEESDNSLKKGLLDDLKKLFLDETSTIPEQISLVQTNEFSLMNLLKEKLIENNHTVIETCTLLEMKTTFFYLINRLQKFCNCNPKAPSTIKLCIIGSDAYINTVLRAYVEYLSDKAPEWQSYLRFYPIPLCNNGSTTLSTFLGSLDQQYHANFCSNKWKEIFDIQNSISLVQEIFNRIKTYLNNSTTTVQVPVAESMIMYKTKFSNTCVQSFIPFICDVKIGFQDKYCKSGNVSIEEDTKELTSNNLQPSSSPPNLNQSVNRQDSSIQNVVNNLNNLSISNNQSNSNGITVNDKEIHSNIQLLQNSSFNSPNIATTSNFGPFSPTGASNTNSSFSNNNGSNLVSPENKSKDTMRDECLDLQVDYWTTSARQFLNSNQNEFKKTVTNTKTTLKNTFRSLQISRLINQNKSLINQISPSLTLSYLTKEKKQKIMRLGKKKEREIENKFQIVEGIHRLVCSYKNSSLKVNVDGVDWTGVKFFQLTAQWQTHIKTFPIGLFFIKDNCSLSSTTIKPIRI